MGGECSFFACMPSKALLRPGELAAEARRVPGVATGPLDADAVLARRDEVVHDLDDSSQLPWLEERGVVLVRGHGRLDGERLVRVGDDVLHARRAVVLASGSSATIPPVAGPRGGGSVDEHRGDDGEARAADGSSCSGAGWSGSRWRRRGRRSART